ncbi:LytR/AlgR family response regulator transcription factor [Bacteroidota bacterium]
MNKIRTIIIDDEQLARDGIKELLVGEDNIEILCECENGEEAIKAIEEFEPDLIFLDIQMPEYSGFEVLEKLNSATLPVIIFVTAFDKYAINAFEVNALDYLLKPFNDERFRTALSRAFDHIKNKAEAEISKNIISLIKNYQDITSRTRELDHVRNYNFSKDEKYLSRIMIREKGKTIFIDVKDVKWFEAMDYYVRIHTEDSSFLLKESLLKLEKLLDPKKFLRIHRSSIVRFDEIKSMSPISSGDYSVILKDGTKLKLSRTRKHLFKSFIG